MNMPQMSVTPDFSVADLTILCAEDVKEARQLLAIYLRRQGARVLEAENGEQALQLYRQHHPDIIISDIRMPIMDGFGMSKVIRMQDGDTPIIFLSAHSEVELLQDAISLGATQYIVKPISFDKLKQALGLALEKLNVKRLRDGAMSHL